MKIYLHNYNVTHEYSTEISCIKTPGPSGRIINEFPAPLNIKVKHGLNTKDVTIARF